MKRVLKSRIFLCIIVGICCIGTGIYAANTYKASEILYNPSNGESITVNDALNSIYNITQLGDATSEDIVLGKTAVVQGNLVKGTNSVKYETLVLFENGSWKNMDTLNFNLYNSTIQNGKIYIQSSAGSGIYATRNEELSKLGYKAIVFECYLINGYVQYGFGTINGTLPKMILTGENRLFYNAINFSKEINFLLMPMNIDSAFTLFLGSGDNTNTENIIVNKIYLLNFTL